MGQSNPKPVTSPDESQKSTDVGQTDSILQAPTQVEEQSKVSTTLDTIIKEIEEKAVLGQPVDFLWSSRNIDQEMLKKILKNILKYPRLLCKKLDLTDNWIRDVDDEDIKQLTKMNAQCPLTELLLKDNQLTEGAIKKLVEMFLTSAFNAMTSFTVPMGPTVPKRLVSAISKKLCERGHLPHYLPHSTLPEDFSEEFALFTDICENFSVFFKDKTVVDPADVKLPKLEDWHKTLVAVKNLDRVLGFDSDLLTAIIINISKNVAHASVGHGNIKKHLARVSERCDFVLSSSDASKPLVLVLGGPSGVGKSYFASYVSEQLGREQPWRVVTIPFNANMSVSELRGAKPGTVGYSSGGLFCNEVLSVLRQTNKEKANNGVVFLLDEIDSIEDDKDRRSIMYFLYSVFDGSVFTDTQGNSMQCDRRFAFVVSGNFRFDVDMAAAFANPDTQKDKGFNVDRDLLKERFLEKFHHQAFLARIMQSGGLYPINSFTYAELLLTAWCWLNDCRITVLQRYRCMVWWSFGVVQFLARGFQTENNLRVNDNRVEMQSALIKELLAIKEGGGNEFFHLLIEKNPPAKARARSSRSHAPAATIPGNILVSRKMVNKAESVTTLQKLADVLMNEFEEKEAEKLAEQQKDERIRRRRVQRIARRENGEVSEESSTSENDENGPVSARAALVAPVAVPDTEAAASSVSSPPISRISSPAAAASPTNGGDESEGSDDNKSSNKEAVKKDPFTLEALKKLPRDLLTAFSSFFSSTKSPTKRKQPIEESSAAEEEGGEVTSSAEGKMEVEKKASQSPKGKKSAATKKAKTTAE